ncbi:Vps52-domain-containing protein [Teratosphaeria nubilosa]|uniref:Vps52-domain-containing protein n=1 Tax=Teratosphaeria nubilosa TaxID=161662 RepID=A0A6G1LGS5_9PEZI|nr:Vps52-domain-containing protein [Teratosphaeria nubilosa]
MWLERFSGQTTPAPSSTSNRGISPAPHRSIQLGSGQSPRRPGLNPRTSSLSVASLSTSTESLPAAARVPNGTTLKSELAGGPRGDLNPDDVLTSILGPLVSEKASDDGRVGPKPPVLAEDVAFEGFSLNEFADASSDIEGPGVKKIEHAAIIPVVEGFENEKDKFEDLHKSIAACDEVLKSVETYLTSFRADLAAVSSEIEHLQDRSTALNNKLQNRKIVEKVLGPEVDAFVIPPVTVRKITEGAVDEAWVKALEDLERRSKSIDAKIKEGKETKAAHDVKPFIEDVSAKAVERIRDYVVAQIKALRSPSINAQVIQQNAFLRYRNVYGFLATRQPQLAEEIGQAYVNTMRWYYTSHFSRYKAALDKLNLFTVDTLDTLGVDSAAKKSRPTGAAAAHDPFSLGRRADNLGTANDTALPSFAAEEDKGTHNLEVPFRAFNLALIDNASAEYSFLTGFFGSRNQSFHATSRKFNEILNPTFHIGHELTRALTENTFDAIGVLVCVRLTQHLAFELQRRKVPSGEGYINGTNMLLWPRFQQIIDAHCESIRKITASLSGKPAGSALSLTSAPASAASTAPHPLTQRFANFVHAITSLSSEAGDDEPTGSGLARLRSEYQAFLLKLSKGIAEARKRDRFLYNNYSLVCTILGDVEGKLAAEVRGFFEELRDGLNVDG